MALALIAAASLLLLTVTCVVVAALRGGHDTSYDAYDETAARLVEQRRHSDGASHHVVKP